VTIPTIVHMKEMVEGKGPFPLHDLQTRETIPVIVVNAASGYHLHCLEWMGARLVGSLEEGKGEEARLRCRPIAWVAEPGACHIWV
jgi:hypothetical protein